LDEIKRIEDVPGFVYLIRNKDLYKIGITVSIKRRVKELKPDEVIAVKEAANMRGIEKLLHSRYKHQRIPQTEYFRLTTEEVDEAVYLLGGETAENYEIAPSLKEETQQLEKVAQKKTKLVLNTAAKETIKELQEWVFDTMNLEAFWVKGPITEEGKVIDHQNFFDFIRTHGHDEPDQTPPPSLAVEEAVERCAVREDLFLRVARAESADEAAEAARAIYLDLCLILLWGVKTKNINMTATDGGPGSLKQMLNTFENFVQNEGCWWTDAPVQKSKTTIKLKKPQGFFTGLAVVVIGCAISPLIGGVFIGLFLLWCVMYQVGNNLSD